MRSVRQPRPLAEQRSVAAAEFRVRVGDVIDRKYRVERILGRGGMGIVVAARHVRLGERVAIKFPLARLAVREDVTARLVREGRVAMRIRSEHVVRVYDVDALATGEPYLVMEYLDGDDLGATVAASGPLPINAAIEFALQAAEALAEAHSRAILHRDIKPSNLFLSRRPDGSPIVKVIDFGIAKTVGEVGGMATSFSTAANAVIGSPLFMSPEQMRAAPEIDARTDIWALGATLHCLLVGQAPFPAASIPEIHELVLRGAPLLRASRLDAPASLEAILLRCLRRDPTERYPTMAAFAKELAEIAPEHARIHALRAARILATNPQAHSATQDGEAIVVGAGVHVTTAARAAGEDMDTGTTGPHAQVSWGDARREPPVWQASRMSLPPRATGKRYMQPLALVVAAVLGAGIAEVTRSPQTAIPAALSAPPAPSARTPELPATTAPLPLMTPDSAAPIAPASPSPSTIVAPPPERLTKPRGRVTSSTPASRETAPQPAASAPAQPVLLPRRPVDPFADPD